MALIEKQNNTELNYSIKEFITFTDMLKYKQDI